MIKKILTLLLLQTALCGSINAQCSLSISPVNTSCDTLCAGTATAVVTGSTGPVTYLWNDANTQTNATATGLCTGLYSVTATDSLGCTATDSTAVLTNVPLFYQSSQINITAGTNWSCVAIGDLDNDGDNDAFIGSYSSPNLPVFNDGKGHFTTSSQTLGNTSTTKVVLADFDSDGDLDAFVANDLQHGNEVWLNDGTGSFNSNGQSLGDANSIDIALGDYDGDGDIDALIANMYTSLPTHYNKLMVNDGNGNFTDIGMYLGNGDRIVSGDLDGDGDLDALTDVIWLNDGNGSFTNSGQSLGGNNRFAIADLDGDNDLDVFETVNSGNKANKIWINDGIGNFTLSSQEIGNSPSTGVELGDLDGDGDIDAFVINSTTVSKIWINDGNGNFYHSGQALIYNYYNIALGDLDTDGDLDAILGDDIYFNGLKISYGTTINNCNTICDGTASVTPLGGTAPFTYLWDDPSAQTTATATGLCAIPYFISLTDANGCIDTESINIDPIQISSVPICLITVDSTSTKNLLVWEKPVAADIDSFRIYREITSNNYQQAGGVHYSNLSEFYDNSTGVDPNFTSYRYKISVLDTCENESPLSDFHKTIHLIVSKDINNDPFLQWGDYEGFAVSSYRILVDSTGTNSWSVFATVPFGVTSYTDANPPQTPFVKYIVEVVPPDTCTANKMGTDYNTTRSNTSTLTTIPILINTISTNTSVGLCDGTATVIANGGAPPYTYLWSDSLSQTTATATGLCAGVYSVVVSDSLGYTEIGWVAVIETGSSNTAPTANFATINSSINEGGATDFIDLSSNGPTSWYWMFSGGTPSTSTAQHPSGITYSTAGSYDVTLVATNSAGTDTLVKTEYITVSGPAPLGLTLTATNASTGNCDGTTTVTVSGGTTPYAYAWNTTPVQTLATATGLCAGTYSVTVTDANSDTLTGAVTVNESTSGMVPVANFTASSSVINEGGSTDFIDLSGNSPTSWSWIFTNGTPTTSTDQNPTGIVYNTAGSFDVTLITSNSFGSDTLLKSGYITVNSIVDIEEITGTTPLFIYPNPFTHATTVVFENEEQASFELVLYDVLGNQVRIIENITTNEITIEKGHLTPGVYFISLQGNGKALRGKLMVE